MHGIKYFRRGLLLAGLLFSAVGQAAPLALLIGVSGYPALPENRRLTGPANDVFLLRAALVQRGIPLGNITLLADGIPGSSALPTRSNILSALAGLARQSQSGDWVIVYFSGHGTQQPQRQQRGYLEPDGLDEVFLPYDTASWDSASGTVRGALLDDDIGAAFAAIRQRGARLWAIFDTCHAGDMAKGGEISRNVAPELLGVPPEKLARARHHGRIHHLAGTTTGQGKTPAGPAPLIFYAAQPDEPAVEQLLPDPLRQRNGKSDQRYFGLFTYLISRSLSESPPTFRHLAQQLARQYKTRPYPTPSFEGDLDTPINF